MNIIINEVPTNLPELEIFKLVNTEWVQIDPTVGIFCGHCGCPVRFNMRTPNQMLGKCLNCQHVTMQQRSNPTISWEDAEIVMFRIDNWNGTRFLKPVMYLPSFQS